MRPSIFILVLAVLAASGCVRVKPYQREYLARPAMVSDRELGQMRLSQHETGSREGADGGTGETRTNWSAS